MIGQLIPVSVGLADSLSPTFSLIDLLILGLATWRLSSLLVNEDGPWEILARMRVAVGIRYDQQSQPYATTVLSELISCVFCVSIWMGLLLSAGYWLNARLTILVMSPFALSAMAVIIERVVSGESKH